MEPLRRQVVDLINQVKLVSDQLEQLRRQLTPPPPPPPPPPQPPLLPQSEECWDDDDEPPFYLQAGLDAQQLRRLDRRSASKCPACGKIGGCYH